MEGPVRNQLSARYLYTLVATVDEIEPLYQVYFESAADAILSIFHPRSHRILAEHQDDGSQLFLIVYYLKDGVIAGKPVPLAGQHNSQDCVTLGTSRKELEEAIDRDCATLQTPAFVVNVPVEIDLTFLRERMEAKFGDQVQRMQTLKNVIGRTPGYVFCDSSLLLQTSRNLVKLEIVTAALRDYINEYYREAEAGLMRDIAVQRMSVPQFQSFLHNQVDTRPTEFLEPLFVQAVPSASVSSLDQPSQSGNELMLSPSRETPVYKPPTPYQRTSPEGDPTVPVFQVSPGGQNQLGYDGFANLPADVIRLMALNFDLLSIAAACRTSRRFNSIICANYNPGVMETFWMQKVQRDFGTDAVKAHTAMDANGQLVESWKEYYGRIAPSSLPLLNGNGFSTIQLLIFASYLATTGIWQEFYPRFGELLDRILPDKFRHRVGRIYQLSSTRYRQGLPPARTLSAKIFMDDFNFRSGQPPTAVSPEGQAIEAHRAEIYDLIAEFIPRWKMVPHVLYLTRASVDPVIRNMTMGTTLGGIAKFFETLLKEPISNVERPFYNSVDHTIGGMPYNPQKLTGQSLRKLHKWLLRIWANTVRL
jgi:hypothetical protein